MNYAIAALVYIQNVKSLCDFHHSDVFQWSSQSLHIYHLCSFYSSPRNYYASPTSGEAYRDRQLTTNFEFWVEIFCVPTCFHVRILKSCLSLRTPRKQITLASSISYQSYRVVESEDFLGFRLHPINCSSSKYRLRLPTFLKPTPTPDSAFLKTRLRLQQFKKKNDSDSRLQLSQLWWV